MGGVKAQGAVFAPVCGGVDIPPWTMPFARVVSVFCFYVSRARARGQAETIYQQALQRFFEASEL